MTQNRYFQTSRSDHLLSLLTVPSDPDFHMPPNYQFQPICPISPKTSDLASKMCPKSMILTQIWSLLGPKTRPDFDLKFTLPDGKNKQFWPSEDPDFGPKIT